MIIIIMIIIVEVIVVILATETTMTLLSRISNHILTIHILLELIVSTKVIPMTEDIRDTKRID